MRGSVEDTCGISLSGNERCVCLECHDCRFGNAWAWEGCNRFVFKNARGLGQAQCCDFY